MNTCFRRGRLAGAEHALSPDPSDWTWERRDPWEGCNNLVCEACDASVRARDGWALALPNPAEAAALYEAEDWSRFPWVEGGPRASAHRLYACRCRHTSERHGATLGLYDAPPEARAAWSCAGHPPPSLPLRLLGMDLDVGVDLVALLRRPWDPRARPTPPEELLHHRLAGTALAEAPAEAVAALLDDDDPALRARALRFVTRHPEGPALDRLVALAGGEHTLWRGVADPGGTGDLEALLWHALAVAPGRGDALALVLARCAAPGAGAGLVYTVARHHPEAVLDQLEPIARANPDAVEGLVPGPTGWTRDLPAVLRRLVALPEVDPEVLAALVRARCGERERTAAMAVLG